MNTKGLADFRSDKQAVFNSRALLWISIGLIAFLKCLFFLDGIEFRVANGAVSSPLGYIWHITKVDFAELNWPVGSADFRFSLPMRVAAWFVTEIGVKPDSIVLPFGILQVFLFNCAIGYLAHTMFRHNLTTVAITAVVAVGALPGINFSNFGSGIGNTSPVLFYTFANAFRLFALAFFLRNKMIWAAIMLALAWHTHVILGLYMGLFIGAGLLVTPKKIFQRQIFQAMGLFIVLVLPLIFQFLSDSTITTGQIPEKDWVFMSLLFNFHWHPISSGYFSWQAHKYTIPFVLLALYFLVSLNHINEQAKKNIPVFLAGFAIATILTILGVFLSDYWNVPVAMKLALPRISEFISLFLVFYIIHGCIQRLEKGGVIEVSVVLWILFLLFFSKPGIAVAPLVALIIIDVINKEKSQHFPFLLIVAGIAGLVPVLSSVFPDVVDTLPAFWNEFMKQLAQGRRDLIFAGGRIVEESFFYTALAATFVTLALLLLTKRFPAIKITPVLMAFLVFMSGLVSYHENQDWMSRWGGRASAFLEAQIWARENTPSDALFVGDLSRSNGWREYSARPYFGSIHGLAHYATLYDSSSQLFSKGIERLKLFDIDLFALDREAVKNFPNGRYGFRKLIPLSETKFKAVSRDQLDLLYKRYGVDYLVVSIDKLPPGAAGLDIAYQNEAYQIRVLCPKELKAGC